MRDLGGSASVAEQEDKVVQLLNLSEEEASEIHRGNRSKLSYRLAWARNYLKLRTNVIDQFTKAVHIISAEVRNRPDFPIGKSLTTSQLVRLQRLQIPTDERYPTIRRPS